MNEFTCRYEKLWLHLFSHKKFRENDIGLSWGENIGYRISVFQITFLVSQMRIFINDNLSQTPKIKIMFCRYKI